MKEPWVKHKKNTESPHSDSVFFCNFVAHYALLSTGAGRMYAKTTNKFFIDFLVSHENYI